LIISSIHLPKDAVMLFPTANGDGRFIWCMPWEDNLNVVGTTDTDYAGDINKMLVEQDEVTYILNSVNAQLKDKQITEDDILSVYAGLRPLINDDDETKKSNKRSRDYQIWWNNDNMLTIAGGKLTSFLSMADNCIKAIEEMHVIETNENEEIIYSSIIDKYKHRYGIKNAALIANIVQNNLDLVENFEKYNYCLAEVYFFIRHQFVQKLDDLLTRRTLITYQMQTFDGNLVQTIATIMAKELNWNENQQKEEINLYKQAWLLMHTWQ